MAKASYKGLFTPKYPEKYVGNSRNIVFRSLWELKLFKYLDTNLNVVSWSSEEFAIPYRSPVDGQIHRYFPDVLVRIKTVNGIRTVLMEIKPKAQTKPPTGKINTNANKAKAATYMVNQAKFEAARKYCSDNNMTFEIITEDELKGI